MAKAAGPCRPARCGGGTGGAAVPRRAAGGSRGRRRGEHSEWQTHRAGGGGPPRETTNVGCALGGDGERHGPRRRWSPPCAPSHICGFGWCWRPPADPRQTRAELGGREEEWRTRRPVCRRPWGRPGGRHGRGRQPLPPRARPRRLDRWFPTAAARLAGRGALAATVNEGPYRERHCTDLLSPNTSAATSRDVHGTGRTQGVSAERKSIVGPVAKRSP